MFIDMPLDELATYRGTNPRPADFDAYWQDALDELAATDPEVEIVPAEFQARFADCYDLWFTGTRGGRIYAKLLQPKDLAQPGPAVLLFHGYGQSSGDWAPKLAGVAQGQTIAALDCRGQGGKSIDAGGHYGSTRNNHFIRGIDGPADNMLMRQIFLDTVRLAQIVMALPGVDAARVGTKGASQGGGLSLACAALEPRIRRAVVDQPFLSDYQRVWEMGYAQAAYAELTTYFRDYDPRHLRQHEVFERLGYIDAHHLAPRVRAEVLMATALMDEVCPPSSQFAVYNNLTSPKTHHIYPDFKHEGYPGFDDAAFAFLSQL